MAGAFLPIQAPDVYLNRVQAALLAAFESIDKRLPTQDGEVQPIVSSGRLASGQTAIYAGPGGHTLELPAPGPRSRVVIVVNAGTGVIAVAGALATHTINGARAVRLGAGSIGYFTSDGVSTWRMLGGARSQDEIAKVGTDLWTSWYWCGAVNSTAPTTNAPTANVLRAIPFVAPDVGAQVDAIAFEVTTLLAGNGNAAIYESDTRSGVLYPGRRIIDGGSISTGAAGVKSTVLTAPVPLGAGRVYWATYCQSAAATVRALPIASLSRMLGTPSTLGAAPNACLSVAFTYAAMPPVFPTGATASTALNAGVAVRYANP